MTTSSTIIAPAPRPFKGGRDGSASHSRGTPSVRRVGALAWTMTLFLTFASSAPAASRDLVSPPWSANPSTTVSTEEVTFRSGGATLSGTLHLPAGRRGLGAVVVTHTASKPLRDTPLYRHLTEMLPALGIAVLTYDRRGSGKSAGTLKDSDYAMLADDAIAASQVLKGDARVDPKRIGIWGLSQGGWLSLLAASRSPDVRFVVSIAAPVVSPDVQMMYRSENYMRIIGRSSAEIERMKSARKAVDDYMRGTGSRTVAQKLVDAIKSEPWFEQIYLGKVVGDRSSSRWRKEIEYDPLPTLDEVSVPSLVLFGSRDPVVPVAASVARISSKPRSNITVRVIAGADHHMATTMTAAAQMDPAQTEHVQPEAAEYVTTMASWLTQQGIARAPGDPAASR